MSGLKRITGWMHAGLGALIGCAIIASTIDAAKAADPRAELYQKFEKAVRGKTVAWVPVWLGVLESEWTRVMKAHFDDYGVKLVVRDPNFKSDVQLQAVSSLINDKPDILIVQNPTTTLLARELKRILPADQLGRQQSRRRHHQCSAAESRSLRHPERVGTDDGRRRASGQERRQAGAGQDLCRERRSAGRLRYGRAGSVHQEPVLSRGYTRRSDRQRGIDLVAGQSPSRRDPTGLLHHQLLG